MPEKINAYDLRNLVNFIDLAMPFIANRWKEIYEDGYHARIQDKPRKVSLRRKERPIWYRGWDSANKDLEQKVDPKS